MDPTLFTDDWKEFLELLNSKRVKYLLIGGLAVILHGYVRATKDMDVWVQNTTANIARLKKVLVSFGFRELAEAIGKKMANREVRFIGKLPYRIDVISGLSGLTFSTAYKNRIMKRLEDLDVPMASLNDLLKNKVAAGRFKDLADAEALERLRDLRKSH